MVDRKREHILDQTSINLSVQQNQLKGMPKEIPDFIRRVSGPGGLGWDPRICTSSKQPGDALLLLLHTLEQGLLKGCADQWCSALAVHQQLREIF